MKYFALIVVVLLLTSNVRGCAHGSGLSWKYDGTTHTFSWWAAGE